MTVKSKETKLSHHTGNPQDDHNYTDKHAEHVDKNHHLIDDNGHLIDQDGNLINEDDSMEKENNHPSHKEEKKPNPEHEHVVEHRKEIHQNDTPPHSSNANHHNSKK